MADRQDVVALKPETITGAVQGIPQFFGLSEASAGTRQISMNLSAFPPGGRSKVHFHRDYETAVYGMSGRIMLCFGPELGESCVIEKGTFCFIPPDVPHVAFNVSEIEPAEAVTARSDPAEQENVVLAPELEPLVERLIEAHRQPA